MGAVSISLPLCWIVISFNKSLTITTVLSVLIMIFLFWHHLISVSNLACILLSSNSLVLAVCHVTASSMYNALVCSSRGMSEMYSCHRSTLKDYPCGSPLDIFRLDELWWLIVTVIDLPVIQFCINLRYPGSIPSVSTVL